MPRGGTSVAETPWTYVRRGDVFARDLARRRVQLDGNSVQQVKVLESAQARLNLVNLTASSLRDGFSLSYFQ